MLPNKLKRLQSGAAPILQSKAFSSGYGIYLNHARGLTDFWISGTQRNQSVLDMPRTVSFVGNPLENGRYEIPFHCHGTNILGGRELAEAVLRMAETNPYVEASLHGDYLHFSTRTANIPLLPEGRIRGVYGEQFTVMFTVSATEEEIGKTIQSGLAIGNSDGGALAITGSAPYEGGEMQMICTSSQTRQTTGLSISTTKGMARVMDLNSFGVFRGAVAPSSFAPYWGSRSRLTLSEPIRSCNSKRDYLYPMRGYAERFTDALPLAFDGLCEASFGASRPSFTAPLPEALIGRSFFINCLASPSSEASFLSTSFAYRLSEDGTQLKINSSSNYNTPEKFLALMQECGAAAIAERETPRYEFFEPITVETRKGTNYLDTETALAPYRVNITYY